MRFIKLGIISIIVIFLILTAISSLLPSQVLVSRAVDIRGEKKSIAAQVFMLPNWQNWMTDANGAKTVHAFNQSSGVLSIGETFIRTISLSDTTIITSWQSRSNMKGTMRIIDHHTPDSLFTVQWQMEQQVKWYPWEKFASITKDELWGGSMEKSLDNLKTLIEAH